MRRKNPSHRSLMVSPEDQQERAPLSIDENPFEGEEEAANEPLDERILDLVAKSPSKVFATRLVTELGLSYEDASAELCGLLKAVGSGASFRFERISESNAQVAMCFTFPPNFRILARRTRTSLEWKERVGKIIKLLIKFLKVVTAFGLVLSLLIVTVAAMIGLVAALVAVSRAGGSDHHRNHLLRQMRVWFYTIRQLLWCYAMFGSHIEGQDPFLSEIAYDFFLVSSVCCGNPGSIFFWWRANHLARRQSRMSRSWGRLLGSGDQDEAQDRRGTWSDRNLNSTTDATQSEEEEQRGLLSLAVEFLFGPVPFAPGPSETLKWRLRGNAIMQKSSVESSISLEDLAPYTDDPPSSLQDEEKLCAGGLAIVTHFHGIPFQHETITGSPRFVFPELLAESNFVTVYEEPLLTDSGTWQDLLFQPSVVVTASSQRQLPSSLQEQRYRLTLLLPNQFLTCVSCGTLNLVGVIWLGMSLKPGGVLAEWMGSQAMADLLQRTIVAVLRFYAILFFSLPVGRLAVISSFNIARERRNRYREDLAYALTQQSPASEPASSEEASKILLL